MQTVYHPASERGFADHGWLQAGHSFSFAGYLNPHRMNFGALRVLNDDIIAPGRGFGTHPHDNMEIVTVPLSGVLEHKDSMGHAQQLAAGEVQAMSAGSGITHSEYNASATEPINLLQLWVMPKEQNIEPRYAQKAFSAEGRRNAFQLVVSPDGAQESLAINQYAYFSLADFDRERSVTYAVRRSDNGCYIFVIDGRIVADGRSIGPRDAMGVWDTESVQIEIDEHARILCVDVPMAF